MKPNKINKNKHKSSTVDIIVITLLFIALILAGYLRITGFAIEKINLTHLAYAAAIVILIILYLLLKWALHTSFRLNKETRNIK